MNGLDRSSTSNSHAVKGVEELVYLFEVSGFEGGYLSIFIAMLLFGSVYALEKIGGSTIWKPWIRGILADYSFVFPTLFWVGFSHFPGRLGGTEQYRVPTVGAFEPTQDRDWVIDFWNLDVSWVFVAVPFGFLMMLLFYYDHVSQVRRERSLYADAVHRTSLPLPRRRVSTLSRSPQVSTGTFSSSAAPASSLASSVFLYQTVLSPRRRYTQTH
jgi:hypothetical protein